MQSNRTGGIVPAPGRCGNRKESPPDAWEATVTRSMSALPNDNRKRGIKSLVNSALPPEPVPRPKYRKLMVLNPALMEENKKTGEERPFSGYLLQKQASRFYNMALASDALANKMQAPAPVELYEIHPDTWEVMKRDHPELAATFEVFDVIAATSELGIDVSDNPEHSLN